MVSRRKMRLILLGLLIATAAPSLASASGWWPNGPGKCRAMHVPVTVAGVEDAYLYGELCLPKGPAPETVQFLVHGSTFNHHYWDFPYKPEKYSHVRDALEDGYATFNIDRIGVGKSTIPPSHLVNLNSTVDTLHQVVTKLRNGEIANGHAFSKVVYFGSSFSTEYGWLLADQHPEDIDAFVLTGLLHFTRPAWIDLVTLYHFDLACEAPRFADLVPDCGYSTTTPFKRHLMFYHVPNTEPAVLLVDELVKDFISTPLIEQSIPYVFLPPPETAPSRSIQVPTLIALGEFDGTACGETGLVCNEANVRDIEAPYYTTDVLDVYIAPDTGHALPLQKSGPQTSAFIHDWLDEYVGAN